MALYKICGRVASEVSYSCMKSSKCENVSAWNWLKNIFKEDLAIPLSLQMCASICGWTADKKNENLGAVSIRKTVLPGMAIPMLKIRRPNGRLIFNMEIALRR